MATRWRHAPTNFRGATDIHLIRKIVYNKYLEYVLFWWVNLDLQEIGKKTGKYYVFSVFGKSYAIFTLRIGRFEHEFGARAFLGCSAPVSKFN